MGMDGGYMMAMERSSDRKKFGAMANGALECSGSCPRLVQLLRVSARRRAGGDHRCSLHIARDDGGLRCRERRVTFASRDCAASHHGQTPRRAAGRPGGGCEGCAGGLMARALLSRVGKAFIRRWLEARHDQTSPNCVHA